MNVDNRTAELLRNLARRPGHDEVKADFRQLLVEEFGVELQALEFERRVPEVRGRLDALVGRTILEAKSDLTREWRDVERRMPDYLADREKEENEKFVGIATDGQRWVVFERKDDQLFKITETLLDPEKPEKFLAWLDGAVALKSSLAPEPLTVQLELGHDSVAFHRAHTKLTELWARLKDNPAVSLKRQLWAQLLKLVYGRELENDALWFQHTFLVIVAKSIALAVLEMPEDDPKRLLSGAAFEAANISGAVESDFFDWVLDDPEGEELVRRIVTHIRRFRLREVQTDVLKILYESLIDRDERHGLGEYYTPDWLAAKIIRHSVASPMEQRVLDPACGSGTFLFHAIRRFLEEAEESGMSETSFASEVTYHVAGMDIHPVAVIIARVTYLLALAPALSTRSGVISIPVYLGDAMQLSVKQLFGRKELTVDVPPAPPEYGPAKLEFPDVFCRDPALFDKAINAIRLGSEQDLTQVQVKTQLKRIVEQHYKRDINREEADGIADLGKTYVTYDELRRIGRDSVWAYVSRNLSRPLAFSAGEGWANVLVGNPPWVAYRHMNRDLQKRFKELAKEAQVYVGGKLATQNDLCALFTARAVRLYLRPAGRLAFVLPLAALTRGQFEKFRSGDVHPARIAFDEAWTMDDSVYPLFPVPSCAVFGRRRNLSKRVPETVRAYSGTLPLRDASEEVADKRLKVVEGAPKPLDAKLSGGSAYRDLFRDGATLYPRMLCLVERKSVGRLGVDPRSPLVVSRRTSQEKEPWKSLPGIEHKVEAEFLRPVLLGESILPYRIFRRFEGVVPVNGSGVVVDAKGAADRGYSGLVGWMRQAEKAWEVHGESDMNLKQRWNYHNELGAQFPIKSLRVAYAKAGTLPTASIIRDDQAVIDHMLYWSAPSTEDEAAYLAVILNSETARSRISDLQARGQFGARHFDKVMFTLPIPRFEPENPLHKELAENGAAAEKLAAAVELPEGVKFQRARKLVRDALADAGIAQRIDNLVERLLDG
ncbi:MAG TPA: N-6 DNA methylase [Hyphomicrobiales bacterium]